MNSAEMRARMIAGEVMKGFGVRLARSPEIVAIAKAIGYDWLFIDMEHSALGIDTTAQICVAALAAGIVPIVRVPSHEPTMASRLLDGGAAGIVVPHVDTPEDIRPTIERCRFHPTGRRSIGGPVPQLGYALHPAAEHMRLVEERTLVCAMIESPRAVENAEAIAAVPGVDMLLVGSNDLALEMGIPGELASPRIEAAYDAIIRGAGRAGKVVGLGGIYTPDLLRRYLPMGFRFALLGSDLTFLMSAGKERLAVAKETLAAT